MATPPIITLTTDFGLSDGYVAAMKGVILSRLPEARIVDLCHAIAPQDIAQAAYLIQDTFGYFPAGTIHVVVVDPGVGSGRGLIALEAQGHLFLAPDNGVLSLVSGPGARAFLAKRPDLWLAPLSHTFHGRDVIAPLAAYLAAGHGPESLGDAIAMADLMALRLPVPRIDQASRQVHGAVIRIDHFGNLITNISQAELRALETSAKTLRLSIGPHEIRAWHETYSQAPSGQPLILVNSSGLIEIAINQGHAARVLGGRVSDAVLISAS